MAPPFHGVPQLVTTACARKRVDRPADTCAVLQLAIVSASDETRVLYTVHGIRYGPNMGTDVLGAPLLTEELLNFTHTNRNLTHPSQFDTLLVNLGHITNLGTGRRQAARVRVRVAGRERGYRYGPPAGSEGTSTGRGQGPRVQVRVAGRDR